MKLYPSTLHITAAALPQDRRIVVKGIGPDGVEYRAEVYAHNGAVCTKSFPFDPIDSPPEEKAPEALQQLASELIVLQADIKRFLFDVHYGEWPRIALGLFFDRLQRGKKHLPRLTERMLLAGFLAEGTGFLSQLVLEAGLLPPEMLEQQATEYEKEVMARRAANEPGFDFFRAGYHEPLGYESVVPAITAEEEKTYIAWRESELNKQSGKLH